MDPHFHPDEHGRLVACYHACRSVATDWKFWLGVTVSFPLEHFLWEKVWPFKLVTAWMGL
jgi:hypothetical protein